jgi:hypothetical protein
MMWEITSTIFDWCVNLAAIALTIGFTVGICCWIAACLWLILGAMSPTK